MYIIYTFMYMLACVNVCSVLACDSVCSAASPFMHIVGLAKVDAEEGKKRADLYETPVQPPCTGHCSRKEGSSSRIQLARAGGGCWCAVPLGLERAGQERRERRRRPAALKLSKRRRSTGCKRLEQHTHPIMCNAGYIRWATAKGRRAGRPS